MAAEEAHIEAGVRERLMQLAKDLGMENLDFLTRPQQQRQGAQQHDLVRQQCQDIVHLDEEDRDMPARPRERPH